MIDILEGDGMAVPVEMSIEILETAGQTAEVGGDLEILATGSTWTGEIIGHVVPVIDAADGEGFGLCTVPA